MRYRSIEQRLADQRDMNVARTLMGRTSIVADPPRQAQKQNRGRSGFRQVGIIVAAVLAAAVAAVVFTGSGAESTNTLRVTLLELSSEYSGTEAFAVQINLQPVSGWELTPDGYGTTLEAQFSESISEIETMESHESEESAGESLTFVAFFSEQILLDQIAQAITEAFEPYGETQVSVEPDEAQSGQAGSGPAEFSEK